MLELLVSVAGVPELPAQAISIVAATPAELHREQDVELPHRAVARLAALARSRAGSRAPRLPPAAHAADLDRPPSHTQPPRFFERSAREVERIAARAEKVREARQATGRSSRPRTRRALGRWQVSFFRDGEEIVQVQVDDRSGAILEQWSGDQVAWSMARGYAGAFGRKLNAPYVWIPLCVLFLLPFVDVRRPFRLLHLDLLVLLAFGVSHYFFNRGEIGVSAPLAYPGAPVPARARAVRGVPAAARRRARSCRTRR